MTMYEDRADRRRRPTISTSTRCARSTYTSATSGCVRKALSSTWNSRTTSRNSAEVDPLHAGDVPRCRSTTTSRSRCSAAASPVCWPVRTSRRPASTTCTSSRWAGTSAGVWYWNRFPGIQCDNDAYCYIPMLEELNYVPTKKYADGAEIYEHCRRIASISGCTTARSSPPRCREVRWDEIDQALAVEHQPR